ncbi:MAG: triose-phosphate isomerase [Phycisphaerae bacterium]|nr:triose-phosphate isomerase [Phycisphaerae bacterium]
MRKKIIAGNWKLNKTTKEAVELAKAIRDGVSNAEKVEVVLAPVFTVLSSVNEAIKGSKIKLAAQDCSYQSSGAFTGEVSPLFLKDVGVSYAILGHSERRHVFNERYEDVGRKTKAALDAGLTPIVCIGETIEEREKGETFAVVLSQLATVLSFIEPVKIEDGAIVIAYEPVWAIGTGKTATPGQAEEVHSRIRNYLDRNCGRCSADNCSILYGGSVKPDNAAELTAQPNIDGALVGGASLKPADFLGIIKNAVK